MAWAECRDNGLTFISVCGRASAASALVYLLASLVYLSSPQVSVSSGEDHQGGLLAFASRGCVGIEGARGTKEWAKGTGSWGLIILSVFSWSCKVHSFSGC